MDPLEQLRNVASRAREDEPPTPDVSDRVIGTLSRLRSARARERAWPGWALQASLVAATIVLGFLGLRAWDAIADPWNGWLTVFTEWWMI